jgi:hypothetical protein
MPATRPTRGCGLAAPGPALLLAAAAVLLAAYALLPIGAAHAQTDHLECFKIKDTASFSATVNLTPPEEMPIGADTGCIVKVRSRQLCIPVKKDVIAISGPNLDLEGQDLANAFLCYSVKCPTADVPDSAEMSDQFGTRTVSGLRRSTICAPAVFGPPPSTTTTTAPVPRSCANATPPNCDGTCNDFNLACAEQAGACVCEYVDVFGDCPRAGSTTPECIGSCQGSMSCLDLGGGACGCGLVY